MRFPQDVPGKYDQNYNVYTSEEWRATYNYASKPRLCLVGNQGTPVGWDNFQTTVYII